MGLISKFKGLFSSEPKKEVILEPVIEAKEEPVIQYTSENYGERIEECMFCKESIETWEKRKTFGGFKYHKECFRDLIKMGKKELNI
jgi:hypothetical protein